MQLMWCINFPHIKPLKSPEVIEFCGGKYLPNEVCYMKFNNKDVL